MPQYDIEDDHLEKVIWPDLTVAAKLAKYGDEKFLEEESKE